MAAPQKAKAAKRTRSVPTPSLTAVEVEKARVAARGNVLSMEDWSTTPVWVEPETKYYQVGDAGDGLHAVPCLWRGEPGMHLRYYLPVLDHKSEPCGGFIPTKDGVLFKEAEAMNLRDYAPQITRWVEAAMTIVPNGDTTILRHCLSTRVDAAYSATKCTKGLLPTPKGAAASGTTDGKAKHELYVELMPLAANAPDSPFRGRFVRMTRYGKDRNVVNLTNGQWSDLAGYMDFICPILATFRQPEDPTRNPLAQLTGSAAAAVCDTSTWSPGEVEVHLQASLRHVMEQMLKALEGEPESHKVASLNTLSASDVIQDAVHGRRDRQNFAFLPAMRRMAQILSDIQAEDVTGKRSQGYMLLEWYKKRYVKEQPFMQNGGAQTLIVSDDDDVDVVGIPGDERMTIM